MRWDAFLFFSHSSHSEYSYNVSSEKSVGIARQVIFHTVTDCSLNRRWQGTPWNYERIINSQIKWTGSQLVALTWPDWTSVKLLIRDPVHFQTRSLIEEWKDTRHSTNNTPNLEITIETAGHSLRGVCKIDHVIRRPCWCTKQEQIMAPVWHNDGVKFLRDIFLLCSVH